MLPVCLSATRLPAVQTVLEGEICRFPRSTEKVDMAGEKRIGRYAANLSISVGIEPPQIFQNVDMY